MIEPGSRPFRLRGNVLTQIQSVFREVNSRIRDVSGGWTEADESVGFICECDDPTCTETVLLSIVTYDKAREAGQPVLVPGHRVSSLLVA